MKKIALLLTLTTALPAIANAGEFKFNQSGLMGGYYGIMETNDSEVNNFANRLVYRADGKLEGVYNFDDGNTLGLYSNYTLVFRQHDTDYSEGDWRFYPYLMGTLPDYGSFSAGYTYNVAFQMHKGAQDITWIGIQDSNIVYFLTNPNWGNGLKSVKFATPKSTAIMNDGRSLKYSYITPEIGNTKFGFSYAPDNASRRGMVSRYNHYEKEEDAYVMAMENKWKLNVGDLYTSAGYGLFNRTDKEASVGARWVVDNFNVSAGYKKAYVDGKKNPISTKAVNSHLPALFDNYRESQAWDFSIGYKFGQFNTNLAYLHTEAENTRNKDDIFLQSNVYSMNKYIDLYLINAYINSHGNTRDGENDNKGYAFITGISVKY